MPRLKTVTPADAQGEVKAIYDDLAAKKGKVFNIFQGLGNSAAALKGYLAFAGALGSGELHAHDREVIYLGLSQGNGCEYCVAAHTLIAKGAGLAEDEILAIRRGEPSAEKHQALLGFVRRVQDTKGFVDDAEVEAVRAAGYTDGQITEAVAFVALVAYTNLFNHVYGSELDFPPAPAI